MTRGTIQAWYLVHKWTSLVCTLFLLMLCVTGLPLIFLEEISLATGAEPTVAAAAPGAKPVALDVLIEKAKAEYPGEVPLFLGWDPHQPIIYVNLGLRPDTPPPQMHTALFHAYTGELVPAPQFNEGVMYVIARLHIEMLAGLPGKLFLGAMGVLFAVAIVSGVVLYRPFMTKLPFGTVRRDRSTRLKWLDLHNLLGVVATGWLAVVALTGVINTLDEPLYASWQANEVAALTKAWDGKPAPTQLGSLDQAVNEALAARPGLVPGFVSYPGTGYSGAHHYGVYMVGVTPLTERNYQPVLVDAVTSKLTAVPQWPPLMSAMYLSQPLHFGDYAGLPLKILWALLDVVAIVVLVSGLYLWLGRRRAPLAARVREVSQGGEVEPA